MCVIMERNNVNRNLTCVLFPGVVKNEEKALDCLGGLRNISEIHSQSKERLGLSFQPNNPYVKKIYADLKPTAGVLFKVKVKSTGSGNDVKREVVSTSVMGRVKQIYAFNSLSDFQFLPVATESMQPKCILEDIIPTRLGHHEEFFSKSVPPFIVPQSFTRSDKPLGYCYTDRKDDKTVKCDEEKDDNVHHRTREDRKGPKTRFKFCLSAEFPAEPEECFIKRINEADAALRNDYDIVKKLFDERPIWSRNAIKFHSKIKDMHLKLILPTIAINMISGPWKLLWIRYGYDPRREPGAVIYQTLDFRLRQGGGVNSLVSRDNVFNYKKVNHVKILNKSSNQAVEDIPEGAVKFWPGVLLPQRQIYYQYCDISLPEVEALLHSVSPLCHEARGWLPEGVADRCRDYVFSYAKQALVAMQASQEKLEPNSSSDEEQDLDDEADTSVAE